MSTGKTKKTKIILIRHGKPDFHAPGHWVRTKDFNKALDDYNAAGLDGKWLLKHAPLLSSHKNELKKYPIISSDLKRALETASFVADSLPEKIAADPIFREIPLPRFPESIRRIYPIWYLLIKSRLLWLILKKGIPEPKQLSMKRIRDAASKLENFASQQGGVVLCAHSFFNFMIGRELRKRGWRSNKRGLYKYFELASFEKIDLRTDLQKVS